MFDLTSLSLCFYVLKNAFVNSHSAEFQKFLCVVISQQMLSYFIGKTSNHGNTTERIGKQVKESFAIPLTNCIKQFSSLCL